jgi:hypothetical protein
MRQGVACLRVRYDPLPSCLDKTLGKMADDEGFRKERDGVMR